MTMNKENANKYILNGIVLSLISQQGAWKPEQIMRDGNMHRLALGKEN